MMTTATVQTESMTAVDHLVRLLQQRKTRRFGCGMHLAGGPLAYESRQEPIPLSAQEEEYLIFAGVGATGLNLGDMQFHRRPSCEDGHGMALMNLNSRTIPSACAAQTTRLFYTNDEGVFFVNTAQVRDGSPSSSVMQLQSTRLDIPRALPFMPSFNQWYTNRPGSTWFLPVTHVTELYLNLLMVLFSEEAGYFVVDTDNGHEPCGLERFRGSRGGHLYDDPGKRRTMSLRELDAMITTLAVQEQGILCQNMLLMQQALGLGGGMQSIGSGRHLLGMEPQVCKGLGFDFVYPTRPGVRPCPLGLAGVWEGYVDPSSTSMASAVRRVFESKFGEHGVYRNGQTPPWRNPEVAQEIQPHSERAIEAAMAMATYVLQTYGRFPAHADAFHMVVACQAHHLDLEFYDAFYSESTLPLAHRNHMAQWHGQRSMNKEGGL